MEFAQQVENHLHRDGKIVQLGGAFFARVTGAGLRLRKQIEVAPHDSFGIAMPQHLWLYHAQFWPGPFFSAA